ncbi:MAG: hypothetical protein R2823_06600 [Acidimicrobiia bacterium]
MKGIAHYWAFLVAAFGAVAPFAPRWPPVIKQWGPVIGALAVAIAYVAADAHQTVWALTLFGVNIVIAAYLVTRSLVRTLSSSRKG